MRLYLSSFGIGDHPEQLTDLLGKDKKAAVIMNAADSLDERARKQKFAEQLVALSEADIEGNELDLRDYFGNQHRQLELDLREYGLVWVSGGNAFILRRAMKQSGFDNVIRKLLLEDAIVYAGYSAGAVVAAPTLQGIERADNATIVPEGYDPDRVWAGLGLVDFWIAPHYKSTNHPESAAIDQVVEYFEQNSLQYKAISDGEAIVINDSTED